MYLSVFARTHLTSCVRDSGRLPAHNLIWCRIQRVAAPFTIRIFVPDGDPEGFRLIDRMNWTGLG